MKKRHKPKSVAKILFSIKLLSCIMKKKQQFHVVILLGILHEIRIDEILENQPPGVPTNVQYEVLSQDTIYLWWNPPADSDRIVVRGYTVGWGIGDSIDSMAISLSGKDSTSVKLDDLLPNTNYTISLSAFNDKGDGKQEKKIICTKPDLLDYLKPPINLHAETWSSSEILLTWDDFPCERCPDFGHANYLVRYAPHNDEHGVVKTVAVDERQVLLSDLLPDTEYEFSIKTRHQYADSEWSTLAFGKTMPKAHPQKQPVPAINAGNEMLRTVYVDRDPSSNLPSSLSENLHQIDNEDSPTIVRLLASHPNLLHIEWERPLRLRRTITVKNECVVEGVEFLFCVEWSFPFFQLAGISPDQYSIVDNSAKKKYVGPLDVIQDWCVGYDIFYKLLFDDADVNGGWLKKTVYGNLESYDLDVSYNRLGDAPVDSIQVKIRALTSSGPGKFSDVATHDFDIFTRVGYLKSDAKKEAEMEIRRSVKVVVENEVGLQCRFVHDLGEKKLFFISFATQKDVLKVNEIFVASAYVSFWKNHTVLRLVIENVQPEDSGTYICGKKYRNKLYGSRNQQVMLFESDSTTTRAISRLISPVLPSDFSFHYCFNFAYRIRSESNGKIFIYALPQPEQFDNQVLLMHFKLSPVHGQQHHWQNCAVKLLPIKHNFRIAIEVIKSAGEKVFIAIDSLQLMPGICKSACNQPNPTANHRQLERVHQPLQYSSVKANEMEDQLGSVLRRLVFFFFFCFITTTDACC
ncbi:putative fibronectin type III domain protein [Trichinella spiralis]|uniref:putative fibronectin type III domain protein n=1 Tax=Trichinella spiralis TaxID=6334 RepID=UPI0001EFDB9B|nr:putative fibronectin type III domain protein [Trichinella spiralis]